MSNTFISNNKPPNIFISNTISNTTIPTSYNTQNHTTSGKSKQTTSNHTTSNHTTIPTTSIPTTSNHTTIPTTSNPTTSNPTTSNHTTSNHTTSNHTTSNPTGHVVQLPNTKSNIITSVFTENFKYQKYTPFGLEFKRITSSQIAEYGQNMSIEIPIVGNILYRSFLEVEVPILNFTDSIITDQKYIEYKQNKLSNITTEINYWTSIYTNMSLYSDIQINGYVHAKKILKLDNITLTFLQSRILNIFNEYQDRLVKYVLFIDTNIINMVNIINYILSLTSLNITELDLTLDSMYKNIINYLKYYNSNKNYSITEYNTVNKGQILAKWVDYMGHYYFNFFELNINGFTLDNYSNDFLHIKQLHSIDSSHISNYNTMIGNTDDIYINKGSPNIIYVPLLFNFSNINESINALPLVGMINSSVKINTRINDLKNLVYLQNWEEMYNTMLIVNIKRKNHNIDTKTNSISRANLPYKTVDIILPENIYRYKCLYIDKRVLDAQYPGIDSDTILQYYGSNNDEYNTKILSLDDWIVLMNNITTDTYLQENTKITLAGYHYFIDYNYVLNLIPKPKVGLLVEYGYIDDHEKEKMANTNLEYIIETHHEIVLDIDNNSLYDSLNNINGLVKDIYLFTREKLYSTGLSKYGKTDHTHFIGKTNLIEGIELTISNEYNLFEYYNTRIDTYNNVVSYNNLDASIPNGVWYKTFSLSPNIIQPSGSINMNVITGQNIAIIVNDNNNSYYNSKINPNNLGIEFKLIYSKYNILKIHNGMAELEFYS